MVASAMATSVNVLPNTQDHFVKQEVRLCHSCLSEEKQILSSLLSRLLFANQSMSEWWSMSLDWYYVSV